MMYPAEIDVMIPIVGLFVIDADRLIDPTLKFPVTVPPPVTMFDV